MSLIVHFHCAARQVLITPIDHFALQVVRFGPETGPRLNGSVVAKLSLQLCPLLVIMFQWWWLIYYHRCVNSNN